MPPEFLLGDARIRPDRLTIERDGQTLNVEPKVMDMLVHLAEHEGETVSRQALMAAVWPGVHVSEDALHRCIWKLRRALGDEPATPRFLATVPRRGYRLLVPVVRTSDPASTAPAPAPAARPWLSIAVASVVVAAVGMTGIMLTRLGAGARARADLILPSDRIEPLTSLDGYESGPDISPDGRTIAFHHVRHSGPKAGQFDVMTQGSNGDTPPVALTDTAANELFPTWSPDGTRVAFRRQDGARCELVSLDIASRDETVVGTCTSELWSRLAWSPDGAGVFSADRTNPSSPARLVRYAVPDGARSFVTNPPSAGRGDTDPVVSPDGRWLAFARASSGDHQDVFVMPLSGAEPRQVTADPGRLGGFHWSSDGRHIVYASDRLGPFRLWTIPAAGGSPTVLLTVGTNATAPVASRAGPRLVYEEWTSTIDVRRATLLEPGAAGHPDYDAALLVSSTRWDTEARWSPDSSRLAFFSDRLGATDVWLANGDGSDPRRLWTAPARFSSWLRWSPDGKRLAFAAPLDGRFDIHVLEVQTGSLQRLSAEASDERWPAWSPDGAAIYFGSNRTGRWEIWRQSLPGGSATRVTSEGGVAPAITGDGLFFVKADAPGLWRQDLAQSGRAERVIDALEPGQTSWDLHGSAVFVATARSGQASALLRYDLRDGSAHLAAWLESPSGGYPEWFAGTGVSISADGRHVAFSAIERSDSDLWIVR